MDSMGKTPPEWTIDGNDRLRTPNRKVRELWEYVYLACKEGQRPVEGLIRNPVLYRGQRHNWPLVPRIGRDDIDYSEVLELASLRELKVRSPLLLGSACRPECDLEWLSLAQHHGMATRLLDWTENALAALWFAVVGPSARNHQPVVWILMPSQRDVIADDELREANAVRGITRTRVLYASHAHERVRAQSGWFTVHHFDGKCFPALENQTDFCRDTDGTYANLGRIDIERSWISRLQMQLANCGISAASVYPDMSGLCQRIAEQMPRRGNIG